jgi:uncharacterized membrane protein YheB (UPF0754 family)
MIDILYLKYASIALVAAFHSWATNWLAVKMLFYPRKPILGFQGLIPKKQKELAHKIAEVVSKELVNFDSIKDKIGGSSGLNGVIGNTVNSMLGNKKSFIGGIIGEFLTEMVSETLKDGLADDSEMKASTNDFIYNMVREKIENFDVIKLEKMVNDVAKKEMKSIINMGFYLGLIIGILQVLLIIILL